MNFFFHVEPPSKLFVMMSIQVDDRVMISGVWLKIGGFGSLEEAVRADRLGAPGKDKLFSYFSQHFIVLVFVL